MSARSWTSLVDTSQADCKPSEVDILGLVDFDKIKTV